MAYKPTNDGGSLVALLRTRRTAWTAEELAGILGMTRNHILKMAKQQRLPSYRLGGAVRFDPAAMAQWLENRSVGGLV